MTQTTNCNFELPTIGSDNDNWGQKLNDNWTATDALFSGTTPVAGIDINGGTIDNVVIGAGVAAAGSFTTITGNIVATDGTVVLDNGSDGTDATFTGAVTGNATTATTMAAPTAFSVSGDLETSSGVDFDGSAAVDLEVAITDQLFLKIYPVGAVYISTVNTSPATLFGGNWTAIGGGRVLQTVNGSSPPAGQNYSANSRNIAVSNLPSHSHDFTDYTFQESIAQGGNPNAGMGSGKGSAESDNDNYPARPRSATTQNTGSGTSFNVQQASYGVYMWKRNS